MVGLRLRPATSCQRRIPLGLVPQIGFSCPDVVKKASATIRQHLCYIYGLPCNQNDLKMASNDLKGQNFSCKFLLSQSIVIVDQDGVFFVDSRMVLLWQVLFLWKIGFVVASVVILDWKCTACF